jgi:hypothetical protein
MKNMHEVNLNKEIINEVENNVRFVDMPNLKNYDTITIENDFIEIIKEAKYERDEEGYYEKVANKEVRQFKKNNLSGVYVEC